MSKPSIFENKSFETSSAVTRFNLAPQINSFNSFFETKPLDETESLRIEKLLVDSFVPGTIDEESVAEDLNQLKLITSEIRAIGRQGTVLMGERVHRVKKLLIPYKDGTFTKWLESTFGTRKTGYNVLSYFELYSELAEPELRDKFKKLPLRAAYVLASREGSLSVKSEIIREYHMYSHTELVIVIQDKLPVSKEDKRVNKSYTDRLVRLLKETSKKLEKRKDCLSETNKRDIEETTNILNSFKDL